jgi:dTDP-4-amino-4,6-dideoxygalactose transaminase
LVANELRASSASLKAFSESLPVAELAAQEILSLPMFSTLTDDQVDRVCEVLWKSSK